MAKNAKTTNKAKKNASLETKEEVTKKVEKSDTKKGKTVTKKTNNSKPKAKKEGYFKLVRKELSLVKWPEFKEVVKYSLSTIVFCLFICAFFILLDLLMSVVKGLFV